MTKKEQIAWLEQIEKDIYVCSLESTFSDEAKSCAIHKTIEELKLRQEPCVNKSTKSTISQGFSQGEPCEDCISRQDAIDEFKNGTEGYDFANWCRADIIDVLEQLPSVEPTRKKGKWIKHVEEDSITRECGCCNFICKWGDVPYMHDYFCPNCGADMRED